VFVKVAPPSTATWHDPSQSEHGSYGATTRVYVTGSDKPDLSENVFGSCLKWLRLLRTRNLVDLPPQFHLSLSLSLCSYFIEHLTSES